MIIERRRPGEEFEYYVERRFLDVFRYVSEIDQTHLLEFKKINERLDKMATLAEELGVEETTLSEVIPALATELTGLETKLTEKETALKTSIETEGHTEASLAAKEAELAAIKQVKESLTPLVEKAKGLIPTTITTTTNTAPETTTTSPAPVQESAPTVPATEHTPETPAT